MNVNWQKLITKLLFWFMTEAILNAVGLDNLADYSEFLMDKYLVMAFTPQVTIVNSVNRFAS